MLKETININKSLSVLGKVRARTRERCGSSTQACTKGDAQSQRSSWLPPGAGRRRPSAISTTSSSPAHHTAGPLVHSLTTCPSAAALLTCPRSLAAPGHLHPRRERRRRHHGPRAVPRLKADQAADGQPRRQRADAHDRVLLAVQPAGGGSERQKRGRAHATARVGEAAAVEGPPAAACLSTQACSHLPQLRTPAPRPRHQLNGPLPPSAGRRARAGRGDAVDAALRDAHQEHPQPPGGAVRPQGGPDQPAAPRDGTAATGKRPAARAAARRRYQQRRRRPRRQRRGRAWRRGVAERRRRPRRHAAGGGVAAGGGAGRARGRGRVCVRAARAQQPAAGAAGRRRARGRRRRGGGGGRAAVVAERAG